MSSYTEAIVVPGGPRAFQVYGPGCGPTTFWIGNPATGLAVTIPAGFASDGPSLPGWLRRALPRPLLHWIRRCLLKPSIVHDRLREDLQFTLLDTDALFLVAMEADRKNWPGPRLACWALQWVAFFAVRTNRSRERARPAAAMLERSAERLG